MDVSATKGILERKGLEKVHNLETYVLWLQEQQARRILPIRKVNGEEHPSELLTQHSTERKLQKDIDMAKLEFQDGCARPDRRPFCWVSRGGSVGWKSAAPLAEVSIQARGDKRRAPVGYNPAQYATLSAGGKTVLSSRMWTSSSEA